MALDMNKMLPGTGGSMIRRKRGSGGVTVFACLILLLIGCGVLAWRVYPRYSERINLFIAENFKFESQSSGDSEILASQIETSSNLPTVTPLNTTVKTVPAPQVTAVKEPPVMVNSEQTSPVTTPKAPVHSGTPGVLGTGIAPAPQEILTPIQRSWQQVLAAEKSKDHDVQKKLLREIITEHPSDEHGGMAYYRLGLLYWNLTEKRLGEDTWKFAYEKLAKTRGGRMSAMALADLWFVHFAEKNVDKSQWEAIRDAYSTGMGSDRATFLPESSRTRAVSRLTYLNKTLIFSRFPCTGSLQYEVKKSDTLDQIARNYGVSKESIIVINEIKPPYWLKEGEILKLLKLTAFILVDKQSLNLTLYLGGKWIKQYPVCIGPDNKTPAGSYSVGIKAVNPEWTDPNTGLRYMSNDPQNIIGTRWIGFDREGPGKGLGIHGTTLPNSIPGRTSMGCVRLKNEDVEELYGFIFNGTEVKIVD